MAGNLTGARNIAEVTIAVANGDLSRKIHRGRARRNFAAQRSHQHHGGPVAVVRLEVTRVAREVGSEGKLGGQAQVSGVAGT